MGRMENGAVPYEGKECRFYTGEQAGKNQRWGTAHPEISPGKTKGSFGRQREGLYRPAGGDACREIAAKGGWLPSHETGCPFTVPDSGFLRRTVTGMIPYWHKKAGKGRGRQGSGYGTVSGLSGRAAGESYVRASGTRLRQRLLVPSGKCPFILPCSRSRA